MKNIFGLDRNYVNKGVELSCLINRTAVVIAFSLLVSGFVMNQSVVAQMNLRLKLGRTSDQ